MAKKAVDKLSTVAETANQEGPQPESKPLAVPNSVDTLNRLDKLERDGGRLAKLVQDVQNTSTLMNLVLFVGFIALIIAVVSPVVQAFRPTPDTTGTQLILQQLQRLDDGQKELQRQIDLVKATPTQQIAPK